jgi:hypothetical protein
MRKECIYCRQIKSEAEFNREHVIPQAFGKFDGQNLVLTCVCIECNDYFAREFDEKLARDTLEGIQRVKKGLKAAKDFRTLGKRSTTRVEVQDGSARGAFGYHVPSDDGSELRVNLLPCIGFSKDEQEFHYFVLGALPSKDTVVASLALKKGDRYSIRTWGMPFDTARAALEAKGFPRFEEITEVPVPKGPIRMETVGIVSHPQFRVMSKIALNYLAAVSSPDFARRVEFNEVRSYVRFDERPPVGPVSISEIPAVIEDNDGNRADGHYVSLTIDPKERVIVQISLLMCFHYTIVLWDGGFFRSRFGLARGCAHFFDTRTFKISRIPPLPLVLPSGFKAETRI